MTSIKFLAVHVSCLDGRGGVNLNERTKAKWFCCRTCAEVLPACLSLKSCIHFHVQVIKNSQRHFRATVSFLRVEKSNIVTGEALSRVTSSYYIIVLSVCHSIMLLTHLLFADIQGPSEASKRTCTAWP